MIIYRHYEILKALQDQPNITTNKLLKVCREKPGSELPNSNDVISKIVYSLRQTGLIATSDASGGKVHKITAKGTAAVIEYEGYHLVKATTEPESIKDSSDNVIPFYLDPCIPVEYQIIELINTIKSINNKPEPTPEIQDKAKKIDTLNRLGNILSDDIKTILDEISADLERVSC